MKHKKYVEFSVSLLFSLTIFLFLMSHKINNLNLEKIGLLTFFSSAIINAFYWKGIYLKINRPVQSLKEATDFLNKFSKKTSSLINFFIRPHFKDPEFSEYKFRSLEKKDIVSAILVLSDDRSSLIPILLIIVFSVLIYGIDGIYYERYYLKSPFFHDVMSYLIIILITFIFWAPTSYSISSYLLKREAR